MKRIESIPGKNPEKKRKTAEKEPFFSSLAGSILFHLVLFTLIFFWLQSRSPVGNRMGNRETESVGIVFSDDSGGGSDTETSESQSSEPQDEPDQPQESESTLETAEKSDTAESTDQIGMNAEEKQPLVTIHGTGSGNRVSGQVIGNGPGEGEGTGQSVGFGELKGKGRRFVYVLDHSESMRWPNDRPIRYALAEAQASIRSLDPKKGALKFQLVLYNHDARRFGNGRLLDVTAANQQAVIQMLDSVQADGGTDPLAALETAIALKPDVIFFLTDADEEIPPMVLARIREMRIKSGVNQIHVMEFGKPDAKILHSFQQLAAQNNGLYIFKDVTGPDIP